MKWVIAYKGVGICLPVLTLACAFILPVSEGQAADEPKENDRPRIGLVLGGGGARGTAHVGVLKVLEELRIPVDYIAGTSMGSIVAGLSASGMSAREIEQEMLSMDWADIFDDKPRREERSLRRKSDDYSFAFKARLGVRDGKIKIPLGVIRGQKFDLVLKRLTLPVSGVNDFDQLPTPFRAVATDLETGKEVILGSGSLARAIRASMAVPAAFDPVEIDDRLLVDGGMANNIPVSVARAMGADVVIVVDVGSPLASRDQLDSVLAISQQLTGFLTLNSQQQIHTLGERDVLILPELGDITSGSFDRVADAIPIGERAARNMTESLQRYSVSPEQYALHLALQPQPRSTTQVIDFIRINNQSSVGDDIIASRISARPGQPLDIEQLEADIGKIYGLEIFEYVNYDLVREDDRTGLVVTVKENSWGPGYLQFGLTSSSNLEGDSTIRMGVVYTQTGINELNGEWRTGGQFGDEPSVFTELHQPLDAQSRYFVSAKILYEKQNINLFDNAGNNISTLRVSAGGLVLGIGREFGTWGESRLGYRRVGGSAEVKTGLQAPDQNVDRGELFLRLFADELDNPYFPRDGYIGQLEYRAARERYGASSDYDQWLFQYGHALSWNANTIIGSIAGGITTDDDAPVEALFQFGGFLRLSGLQEDQLTGQRAGLVRLIYLRSLDYDNSLSLFKSYAGISLEVGNTWQTSKAVSFDNTISAGSLFLGFDTPIGPIYLGYGFTDTDEQSAFIYIGPRFTF